MTSKVELLKLGGECAASYEVKDMFDQTVQTDLFGNVVGGKKGRKKR